MLLHSLACLKIRLSQKREGAGHRLWVRALETGLAFVACMLAYVFGLYRPRLGPQAYGIAGLGVELGTLPAAEFHDHNAKRIRLGHFAVGAW